MLTAPSTSVLSFVFRPPLVQWQMKVAIQLLTKYDIVLKLLFNQQYYRNLSLMLSSKIKIRVSLYKFCWFRLFSRLVKKKMNERFQDTGAYRLILAGLFLSIPILYGSFLLTHSRSIFRKNVRLDIQRIFIPICFHFL